MSSEHGVAHALKVKLSAERNWKSLGLGLVSIVVSYLVEDAEVKDVNEFDMTDLLEVAKAAWAEHQRRYENERDSYTQGWDLHILWFL